MKLERFNNKLSKVCKKNKIDVIDNKNLDGSCLNSLKIVSWIISIEYDTKNCCEFLIAAMLLR